MLGPWASLILVMLYEYFNGDASNWAAYFSVLPADFNTLMYWTEDELAELQASAVVNKIGKESANEMFLEQLLPVIKEIAPIFFAGDERAPQRAEELRDERNLALMHRMGSLIMAYAFDIEPTVSKKDVDEEGYASEDEDAALPKGMVPLADMLNADADRNNARDRPYPTSRAQPASTQKHGSRTLTSKRLSTQATTSSLAPLSPCKRACRPSSWCWWKPSCCRVTSLNVSRQRGSCPSPRR